MLSNQVKNISVKTLVTVNRGHWKYLHRSHVNCPKSGQKSKLLESREKLGGISKTTNA